MRFEVLAGTFSQENSLYFCSFVRVCETLILCSLYSVCCGLIKIPRSFMSTYTQLDNGTLPAFSFTLPPEGKNHQLALFTSKELLSPWTLSSKHLVLVNRKLYSLAFVSAPFMTTLVFYSESNVLTKAAWRGLFP